MVNNDDLSRLFSSGGDKRVARTLVDRDCGIVDKKNVSFEFSLRS